MYIYIQDRFYY